jgi:serine/threonine-protein kinase
MSQADPLDPLDRLAAACGDRYAIGAKLGQGGMGTVYLAVDRKHERQVAIKLFRPDVSAMIGPERFLREIQVTAHLQHPHILPLFDSGDASGILYYIMPYVQGDSLRDRMQRDKRLSVEESLDLGLALAGALDYAHHQGVIHRDIKPENILLGTGVPVLADFGIAKASGPAAEGSHTAVGFTLGTPVYMSPEQAAGDPDIDGRSDLYSLAVVLFEALAGTTPYRAGGYSEMIARKLTASPESLTRLRGEVPEWVERALVRALAGSPAERFSTAGEFARALAGERWRTTVVTAAPAAAKAPRSIRAIAVLPFVNASGNAEDEFLSDGISDELIHRLGGVEGLHVVARTSSFAFKGKAEDLRVVGERLGVGAVLEGTVRRAGSRLRITAQLVSAADGFRLWAERYDREVGDVFAIQDDIARATTDALRLKLFSDAPPRAASPVEFGVYEMYLRGLQEWNRRTEDGLAKSVEWFERALAVEPRMALAHAALANARLVQAIYGALAPHEALPRAEQSAAEALRLDPELVEALTADACLRAIYRWEWAAARDEFATAITRNPAYATARQWYALHCLVPMGRLAEAREELGRALRYDPLSPTMGVSLGVLQLFAGDAAGAVTQLRRILEAEPGFGMAHRFLGEALGELGDPAAFAAFAEADRLTGSSPEVVAAAGYALARAGRRGEAEQLLARLLARRNERHVSAALIAQVHLGLGDIDTALMWLDRAVEERSPYLLWLGVRPAWADLRGNPRFTAVLDAVGLGR